MKHFLWSVTFLVGLPILLTTSFLSLNTISSTNTQYFTSQVLGASTSFVDPAFPILELSASIGAGDSRAIIVKNYLTRYDSPLAPYARHLVETADRYQLDYRLLVAIARQESGLCRIIPAGSHNCWGYGIYGDNVIRFANYPEAMEVVAAGLKKNYIDKGLDTPEKIMAKYTPPSLKIGGPWAKGINQFFDELE